MKMNCVQQYACELKPTHNLGAAYICNTTAWLSIISDSWIGTTAAAFSQEPVRSILYSTNLIITDMSKEV